MSQRDHESHEWKKRHFRESFGFELEELEGAVWEFAGELDRIPKSSGERFGCSLCDDWLAPEDTPVYKIYSGDNLESFHAHIDTAHKGLPRNEWPGIVKK